MKTFVLILLAVFSFVSCNGQAGGLGFWNGQDPTPPQPSPDSVSGYMRFMPFLVVKEGNSEVMYVADTIKNEIVRYRTQANIQAGNGTVIYRDLVHIWDLKYAEGNLYILDSLKMRVKRLNTQTLTATTLYKTSDLSNRLLTIAPIRDPVTNTLDVLGVIIPSGFFVPNSIVRVTGIDSYVVAGQLNQSWGDGSNPNVRNINMAPSYVGGTAQLVITTQLFDPGRRYGALYDKSSGSWAFSTIIFPTIEYLGWLQSAYRESPLVAYNARMATHDWGSRWIGVIGNNSPGIYPGPIFARLYNDGTHVLQTSTSGVFISTVIGAPVPAMYAMTATGSLALALVRINENNTVTTLRSTFN